MITGTKVPERVLLHSFAKLLEPLTPDEFFRRYWEQAVLVQSSSQSDRFGQLVSLDDVDALVCDPMLRYPDIRLAQCGPNGPDVAEYIVGGGRLAPAAVAKLFVAGATIICDRAHLRIAALGDLCRDLGGELGIEFQTNLYLTPPGAQGFPLHYDTHDVFVLQVMGSKKWSIFDSPFRLPLGGQPHEADDLGPGEKTMDFELHAGDIAYLPRGYYHQAQTSTEMSLHITLGAMNKTWSDFVIEAVAEACGRDAELRAALPVGMLSHKADPTQMRAAFAKVWQKLSGAVDFGVIDELFQADFRANQSVAPKQILSSAAKSISLHPQSRVQMRPDVAVTEPGDGHIILEQHDRSIKLPDRLSAAIARLSGAGGAVAGELQGMPDWDSRLLLCRRLVEEGFAIVLTDQVD